MGPLSFAEWKGTVPTGLCPSPTVTQHNAGPSLSRALTGNTTQVLLGPWDPSLQSQDLVLTKAHAPPPDGTCHRAAAAWWGRGWVCALCNGLRRALNSHERSLRKTVSQSTEMPLQQGRLTDPGASAGLAAARLALGWPACWTSCPCCSQQVTGAAITQEERGPQ